MAGEDDHTQQALQQIAKIWQVDDNRVSWMKSRDNGSPGFDWWPGDFCVQVRAHPPPTPGDILFKLDIRTGFLRGLDLHDDRFEVTACMPAAVSCPTYAWSCVPGERGDAFGPVNSSPRIWFNSSAYISSDNIDWMPKLLARLSILQPINAQTQAETAAQRLGGAPDRTGPVRLRNAGLHESLDDIARFFAPAGNEPSRWADTGEFEEQAERWSGPDECFGVGSPTAMELQTPFGANTASISFRTEAKHPELGHGLWAILALPDVGDLLSIAKFTAELNLLESVSWTGFPLLGCWGRYPVQPGSDRYKPTFSLFVPNVVYGRGLAGWIIHWFLRRARWARETRFPRRQDLPLARIFKQHQKLRKLLE